MLTLNAPVETKVVFFVLAQVTGHFSLLPFLRESDKSLTIFVK